MSRSPSPLQIIDESHSLPISTALRTHLNNVPSANFSLYLSRSVQNNNNISVCIDQSSTQIVDAPLTYWKWPGKKESSAPSGLNSAARPAMYGGPEELNTSDPGDLPSQAQISPVLTLKNVPLRIQKHPDPPHINWIQRAADMKALQNQETMAKQTRKQEIEELERQHAESIKEKGEQALRAATLDFAIDDKNGFIKVRGTRKRVGATMDLEIGRVRRKYMYVFTCCPCHLDFCARRDI
jgi:hypothetical protein